MRSRLAVFVLCLSISAEVQGQRSEAVKEVAPRLVNFDEQAISLADAVKALAEQTGNVVVDRRSRQTDVRLRLQLKNATFWQSLDDIVSQARCGYSVYQDDGKVALIDTPLRQAKVDYAGIFRVALRRLTLVRDEATGSHTCTIALEVAWEPRFQPFLLDVGPMEATFAGTERGAVTPRIKLDGLGQVTVAGRGAAEVDVRLPAPPRSATALASLQGRFKLLGPSKMLTFDFAGLKPGQAQRETKEDVQVSATPVLLQGNRWSFDVVVVNPPGNPRLESFQEELWLSNNQISLWRTQGSKTETVVPLSDEREDREPLTSARAFIRYHFTRNVPASPSGWTLRYRTPGRIVYVPVAFGLKDMPLP